MTSSARRRAHGLRAEAHRLKAFAWRLEDAAERMDPLGLRYEQPEEDRGAYHDRMATYYAALAAGKSCDEAESWAKSEAARSPASGVIEPRSGAAMGVASAPGSQGA